MFFTQDDYKKIQQWLIQNSVKDTEFNEANIPFNGEETITIVQGNQNKKVFLKDLIAQVFNLGISDFINITDKYDAPNISLEEAIRLIPSRARKEGQVITFLDREDHWHIYQFKGILNQWNVLDTWEDLFNWEKLIIDSILPDEEDLTKSLPDANGNSYLSLKDRAYNPEDFSGLGRVILRKNLVDIEDPENRTTKRVNLLTQNMVSKENTIYEIRYDFNLNGEEITIPEGCVLDFQGGSLSNGICIFNSNNIISYDKIIFHNIICKGILNPQEISTSWIEVFDDDCTDALNSLFAISKNCTLKIEDGIYNVSTKNLTGSDYSHPSTTSILHAQNNSTIKLIGQIHLKPTNRRHYNIIGIYEKENVTICGNGKIIGDVETHDGDTGQWGHGVGIYASSNIIVKDIESSYCWGDGIDVAGVIDKDNSKYITIDNVTCQYNRRQGISVEGCYYIWITNSRFCNTGKINGTNPKGGIDIEPTPGRENDFVYINNCLLENNPLIITKDHSAEIPKGKTINVSNVEVVNSSIIIANTANVFGCKCMFMSIEGVQDAYIHGCIINEYVTFNQICKNITITNNYIVSKRNTSGLSGVIYIGPKAELTDIYFSKNTISLEHENSLSNISQKMDGAIGTIDLVDCNIIAPKRWVSWKLGNVINCNLNINRIHIVESSVPDGGISYINNNIVSASTPFIVSENISEDKIINIINNTIYCKASDSAVFQKYSYSVSIKGIGNTINGLNNFESGSTDDRPILTSVNDGYTYWDRTLNRQIVYKHPSWINVDGSPIGVNFNSSSQDNRPTSDLVYPGFKYHNTTTGNQSYLSTDKSDWLDAFGFKDKRHFGEGLYRPKEASKGHCYYDFDLEKPIWWTGEKWVDAMGADV